MKTKPFSISVSAFLQTLDDPKKYTDSQTLISLMEKITGNSAQMWGTSMIGFGSYHYPYDSGREGDWFVIGFPHRKLKLSIYITSGLEQHAKWMEHLGKFKSGKSCIYVKSLADIDISVLSGLINDSLVWMQKNYKVT